MLVESDLSSGGAFFFVWLFSSLSFFFEIHLRVGGMELGCLLINIHTYIELPYLGVRNPALLGF